MTNSRDGPLPPNTIDGLAIVDDRSSPGYAFHTQPPGGLPKYYSDNVIGGPGAFLITVEEFPQLRRRDHPQDGRRDRRDTR